MTPFLVLAVGLRALAAGAPPDPYRVGVLVWSDNIPGQVAMRAGLEAEAARLTAAAGPDHRGLALDVQVAGDGDEGIRRQVAQMEAMVADGVDLIIVQPTDNAALVHPLEAANRAGIPVVAYDQYILRGELAAYVSSDNRGAGRDDGDYVASLFPDEREIKVVLVEYPHVSSTVERLDGFLDALRQRGQAFRVVGAYTAVDPAGGRLAGQRILAEHPAPGSIDVVFTVNDGGGLAVVDALAAAGRTEVVVATVDGDPHSVENLRAGRLTVIDSAQFCGPLGAQAMRAGYALLQGEAVPAVQLVPTFPITRETVDRYPGWMGPLPARFEKPWPSGDPWWDPTSRAPVVPVPPEPGP